MNTKNILFIFILSSYIVYSCPEIHAVSPIRINEIAWMGTNASQYGEWIELYNNSSDTMSLQGWTINKRKDNNDLIITSLTKEINSHSYYLIERTTPSMLDPVPNVEDETGKWNNSLSNSGELLILKDKDGIIIDSVDGLDDWKINGSPETIGDNETPKRTAQLIGSSWKTLPPTPKTENKNQEEIKSDKPLLKPIYKSTVRFNEILANPSGNENTDEFIELFNTSDTIVDLSSWSLKDASVSGKYAFPTNTSVQPKGFFVIYRKTFGFALNNSNETLSLLDPNGVVQDTLSYKTAYEDISYNFTPSGWRGGTPTPDAPNEVNTLPETKEDIPRKGYVNVPVDFDARGGDADRDTLKYVWDFGDGHKSYKEKTTHTYEKEGQYTLTLKTTDGKDDTLETFTLTIEPFPHKNVRIISLLLNPRGKDTGAEQIVIRNNEKKKINLNGYRIAIGWKKLINHTIHEDVIIKPKGEAIITHTEASFTLPNQKAKIELRAPDGKTLQKIHYKLEKPITEDVWYRKEKGKKWEQQLPIQKQKISPPKKELTKYIALTPPPDKQDERHSLPLKEEDVKEKTIVRSEHLIPLHPHTSLQTITSYGTNIHIPEEITLSLISQEPKGDDFLPTHAIPPHKTHSLLRDVNSLFNTFLNTLK